MNAERMIRFLSEGTTESSRRLIAYRCAMILLVVTCSLAAVVCYQGMEMHPVDNGLLTALSAIVLIIAGLAREIYHRKAENVGVAAPPATIMPEGQTAEGGAKIEGLEATRGLENTARGQHA